MATYQSINDLKNMVENVQWSNIPQEVLDCNSAYSTKENFFELLTDDIISKVRRTRLENKKELQVTTKNGVIENLVNGRIYENNVRIGTPDTITKVERFRKAHKNAEKLFRKDLTVTDPNVPKEGALFVNGTQMGAMYGDVLMVSTNTRNKKAPKIATVVLLETDGTKVSEKIYNANLHLGKRYS